MKNKWRSKKNGEFVLSVFIVICVWSPCMSAQNSTTPNAMDVNLADALIQIQNNNPEKALEMVQDWRNNPKDASLNSCQNLLEDALLKANSGQKREALHSLSEFLQDFKECALTYDIYGSFLLQFGYLDEAEVQFKKALKFDEWFVDAIYNLGLVALLKGDTENSLIYFQNAVSIAPDFTLAYNARAISSFAKGYFEFSVDDFKKAQKNPLLKNISTHNLDSAYIWKNRSGFTKTISQNSGFGMTLTEEMNSAFIPGASLPANSGTLENYFYDKGCLANPGGQLADINFSQVPRETFAEAYRSFPDRANDLKLELSQDRAAFNSHAASAAFDAAGALKNREGFQNNINTIDTISTAGNIALDTYKIAGGLNDGKLGSADFSNLGIQSPNTGTGSLSLPGEIMKFARDPAGYIAGGFKDINQIGLNTQDMIIKGATRRSLDANQGIHNLDDLSNIASSYDHINSIPAFNNPQGDIQSTFDPKLAHTSEAQQWFNTGRYQGQNLPDVSTLPSTNDPRVGGVKLSFNDDNMVVEEIEETDLDTFFNDAVIEDENNEDDFWVTCVLFNHQPLVIRICETGN